MDKIDFKLQDTEADVLGDAYEYLIEQFASRAGKKAGEFYTPQQVYLLWPRNEPHDLQLGSNEYDFA